MSYLFPSAEGYIFDFNGTLILDDPPNWESWGEIIKSETGYTITKQDIEILNGRTSYDTVKYFIEDCSDERVDEIMIKKTIIYRRLLEESGMGLAPGAERILKFIRESGKVLSIATSATKEGMDYYIAHFNLLRYFERELIVTAGEDIRPKPHGDIFLKASRMMGLDIRDTVIFEDSVSGVMAALDAGCPNIFKIGGVGTAAGARCLESFEDFILPSER